MEAEEKMHWYQMGDRNMKYFHACANQRRKKNFIYKISDQNNIVVIEREDIEVAFKDHFEGIYTSSNPTTKAIEGCLKCVENRVTKEMNIELL